ncbi:putative urea transporter [Emiliania huxleyi CCMP1516]|uniref:Urea transporter n=2 Tax=Emiliania huxleyi TaxID=2903 RepID=A0A0D3L153_EMIH1|nr:putative urea transporter [Emiliania huxleyi CCMP1516]EOD41738.1 putative urea transporter [Emiliania huxleyi CCMP1516]|eukprot:XP_005794167.1 putative urea transporter [Emiliania huxleyi CCMP1516]
MAGEGVTAMIVAADAGDNPLADRREDRKAAAERERKAKVAKVASQATNAMAAVRAQLDLREKGAADKAANKANDDAGAPVRASSTMLERVFAARLDGPDKYVVARRKERKTAAGAGTAADLAAGLEKMTDSVVKMARRDGADGNTVTAEHKALLDDVAVEQGRKAIVARAASIPNNSNTHTSFGAWSPYHARARRADRVASYVYAVPGDIECTSATEKQCNALGSAALLWERLRFLNYLPSKTDQGIPVNSTYTMPFPDGAYVPTADNPGPGAWESLVYVKEDYHHGPVNGNRGGSYLTMLSEGGLSFGVVNIVGNFGTVFVDQSYWQSAIAARPSSAHRGYLLGGLVWFTIPMSLATALGLSSLALNVKMPAAEAGAGLAPPAAAIAITSTGSAECIAVASLFAYDIYRKYIKPDCTGAELLKVSRLVVVGYGIVCGLFGYFLYGVGVGLGWVYCFMGNPAVPPLRRTRPLAPLTRGLCPPPPTGTMIGSAVIPVSCCLCTRYMTANGAMAGAWLGQILALVSWMAVAASRCTDGSDPDDFVASDDYPTCETGSLDVNTLGNINAQTTGSIVALCVSGIIAFVVAAIEYKSGKETPFEWETMREGIKRVEQAPRTPLSSVRFPPTPVKDELPEFEMTAEYLDPAAKYVFKYGVGYSVFLIFVWPLAVIAWGVFDKANYTLWASVAYCWGYIGSLVIVVLPVYESWGSLSNVLTCTKPAPEAKE